MGVALLYNLGIHAVCAGSPSTHALWSTGRSSGQPAMPEFPGRTKLLGHGIQSHISLAEDLSLPFLDPETMGKQGRLLDHQACRDRERDQGLRLGPQVKWFPLLS